MSQIRKKIGILEKEKQKLLKMLANVAVDDDVSRDALESAISQLDKTIGHIQSASKRTCGLTAEEEN
ncbi:MAG: hypothetical protein FWG94_12365 [Oscillospiraceae bacterium]|nr:hypothetical protein [Oscillospiraceae bacterium]